MNMPNFLIIGAHKAGTSAMHAYLKQHSQIYMSPMKEPNFFAWGEDRFPDFQGPGDKTWFSRNTLRRLEDYKAEFSGA
ncbi:MAG TPA: sulfotransferase, partial [Anaerolineae bacterium]|nr:sulfotransferase [Anaerolineae bacterium]